MNVAVALGGVAMEADEVVVTSCGVVRRRTGGGWLVEHDGVVEQRSSLGAALLALSELSESSGEEYSVEYRQPETDLLQSVEHEGADELFPNSYDGWTLEGGFWVSNNLRPGGDPESVATLVTEAGDMGVHVMLYDFRGVYVLQWLVVDFSSEGMKVLGRISEEAARQAAQDKADELAAETGLELPYMLGAENLERSAHYPLPDRAVLTARASSAWPYDSSEIVVIDIYRRVSDGSEEWLVTAEGSATVVGSYPTWQALNGSMCVPDDWEIEVDWLIDEPEE